MPTLTSTPLFPHDISHPFLMDINRMMLYLCPEMEKKKLHITSFLMVTPFFTKGEYHSPFRPVRG
jgi:hypothetical protein